MIAPSAKAQPRVSIRSMAGVICVGLNSRGLVVFQILVTCILLIGSILQLRTIRNQQNVDL